MGILWLLPVDRVTHGSKLTRYYLQQPWVRRELERYQNNDISDQHPSDVAVVAANTIPHLAASAAQANPPAPLPGIIPRMLPQLLLPHHVTFSPNTRCKTPFQVGSLDTANKERLPGLCFYSLRGCTWEKATTQTAPGNDARCASAWSGGWFWSLPPWHFPGCRPRESSGKVSRLSLAVSLMSPRSPGRIAVKCTPKIWGLPNKAAIQERT